MPKLWETITFGLVLSCPLVLIWIKMLEDFASIYSVLHTFLNIFFSAVYVAFFFWSQIFPLSCS